MYVVRKGYRGARFAWRIFRTEGTLALGISFLQYLQYLQGRLQPQEQQQQVDEGAPSKPHIIKPRRIKFAPMCSRDDILAADFHGKPYDRTQRNPRHTKVAAWIMSPPGSGGGHQNIFRFIDYLIDGGWTVHVYLYSEHHPMTLSDARANVAGYSDPDRITFHQWQGDVVDCDALFATGWETAYPVFNAETDGAKFYFVQDFEPDFYATGSQSLIAENTYRMGFHGITAGDYLKQRLETEYGMECFSWQFGVDTELYQFTNTEPRNEIFFYARPVTERRAFEVGVMALELFHKAKPDYVINLAGWDVTGWEVPFRYVNHKVMSLDELPALYNKCAAGLVLSLTNMSLIPLELLSTGSIAVVNDGMNNRLVSDNPFIHYVTPAPQAIADELVALVEQPDLPDYAQRASESVAGITWDDAGSSFLHHVNNVTGNVPGAS